MLLEIKNLHVSVDGKAILKGIDLSVNKGELHAIMGPNGSGKSTIANTLAGKPGYEITQGTVTLNGVEINDMPAEVRAQNGLFLAFQYPLAIPGVTNMNFLKVSTNAIRKAQGMTELDAIEFLALVKQTCKTLQLDESFLYRPVNEGFSGGEKKRNEILQMALLNPSLAILDEIDSGLDIDALKAVSNNINAQRTDSRSFIVITHYQRLLDYVEPDVVHVFSDGKIIQSGDKTLAYDLEKKGYGWVTEDTL